MGKINSCPCYTIYYEYYNYFVSEYHNLCFRKENEHTCTRMLPQILTCTFTVCINSHWVFTCFFSVQAQEIPGVKVFRFEGALMFASFDYFKNKLIEKSGLDPFELRKQKKILLSKTSPLSHKMAPNTRTTKNQTSPCTLEQTRALVDEQKLT